MGVVLLLIRKVFNYILSHKERQDINTVMDK